MGNRAVNPRTEM